MVVIAIKTGVKIVEIRRDLEQDLFIANNNSAGIVTRIYRRNKNEGEIMTIKELVETLKTVPLEGDSHTANPYRCWETFCAISQKCGVETPKIECVPIEGDTMRVQCTLIEGAKLFVVVSNSQYGGIISTVDRMVYHDQPVELGCYPE